MQGIYENIFRITNNCQPEIQRAGFFERHMQHASSQGISSSAAGPGKPQVVRSAVDEAPAHHALSVSFCKYHRSIEAVRSTFRVDFPVCYQT